jgi:hypothetical protein
MRNSVFVVTPTRTRVWGRSQPCCPCAVVSFNPFSNCKVRHGTVVLPLVKDGLSVEMAWLRSGGLQACALQVTLPPRTISAGSPFRAHRPALARPLNKVNGFVSMITCSASYRGSAFSAGMKAEIVGQNSRASVESIELAVHATFQEQPTRGLYLRRSPLVD